MIDNDTLQGLMDLLNGNVQQIDLDDQQLSEVENLVNFTAACQKINAPYPLTFQ